MNRQHFVYVRTRRFKVLKFLLFAWVIITMVYLSNMRSVRLMLGQENIYVLNLARFSRVSTSLQWIDCGRI